MVGVVQLVEHQVVILAVAGSSPVAHPSGTPEDVERHFRGFFWFVRQPQSPLPPPGGVATATNRALPSNPCPGRANVPLVASDRPKATFAHIGVAGTPQITHPKSLGRRLRLPDTCDGPLANVSLVCRNLVVDDGQVVLQRRDPGSNQLLMRLQK